jgi:uncharacterized paraquat-inducible protein A
MNDMKKLALLAMLFALLITLQAEVAWACPGCKQALATADGEQANMVNGYYWSILFMLAMPFTLLALFGGSMYLAVRKARKQAALSGKQTMADHFTPDVAARLYGTSSGGQSV